MGIRKKLKEKLKEALQAVLPIIGLVLLLSFTIAPISPSILLCFLIGGILLIAGIVFFTLGAELAMSPMGERVGTAMTQSKKRGSSSPIEPQCGQFGSARRQPSQASRKGRLCCCRNSR